MKITANQLRNIIAEEVSKVVNEDAGPASGLGIRAALAVVDVLKERVPTWTTKPEWSKQCDAARDDLADAFEGAMEDVLNKLYNEEYI